MTVSNIEALLNKYALIEQAVVMGEKREFLAALIALNRDEVRKWAEDNRYGQLSYKALLKQASLINKVQRIINEVNESLESDKTIEKFALLPGPLDMHNKHERFKELLDSLYDE